MFAPGSVIIDNTEFCKGLSSNGHSQFCVYLYGFKKGGTLQKM